MATEPQAFSTVLRQASAQDHSEAESTGYISALLAGRLPLSAYAALSAQLYFVYAALEEVADAMRADPVAGGFAKPELTRRPALEDDLAHLLGDGWAGRIAASPATAVYVERLRESAAWPGGFVAHHYVRYLGDLSGGLFIGREVERIYELDGGRGTAFYRFDGIPEPKVFKDGYRALLDAAPWGEAERERIVAEVRLAYRLNTDLLRELDALVPGGRA